MESVELMETENSEAEQEPPTPEIIIDDILDFKTDKGTIPDPRSVTFTIIGEDHTLGNALRYTIMLNPEVEYCGYSIPHPSEEKLNLRIQTTENITAIEALSKGLEDLRTMCDYIKEKFIKTNLKFDKKASQDEN
ncbi:hypothetical protein Glove_302g23 [Diversispora epigaea]|uniref:DNA-directed RNA polymerases I and III subunit RPAC2 n=1 Tax=Diversispora epigaea TaxID=1348612 RepID=A0A397I0E2_9GLOM|nr:hypothetical protein Glove_302g23 [Diversispora epigaea]